MLRNSLAFVIALAVVVCGDEPLSAQTPGSPARLSGSVRTESGLGVDLAEIELVGARRRFRTGNSGRFQFNEIPSGRYFLSIERTGFQSVYTALTIEPGDHQEYHFTLHPPPAGLPSVVESVAEALRLGLRNFEPRSQIQDGTFLTRDAIEGSGISQLSFLVRQYLPTLVGPGGVQDITRSSGRGRAWNVGPTGCQPAVAINGNLQRERIPLDLFELGRVEALEIFTAEEIPSEFRNRIMRRCGLVVVWL